MLWCLSLLPSEIIHFRSILLLVWLTSLLRAIKTSFFPRGNILTHRTEQQNNANYQPIAQICEYLLQWTCRFFPVQTYWRVVAKNRLSAHK